MHSIRSYDLTYSSARMHLTGNLKDHPMSATVSVLIPPFPGPEGQEDMPYLLTPGPLTTSRTVKLAMLADWGSRDVEFRKIVGDIRKRILEVANCDGRYECVIMQGSVTFAIETRLGSL